MTIGFFAKDGVYLAPHNVLVGDEQADAAMVGAAMATAMATAAIVPSNRTTPQPMFGELILRRLLDLAREAATTPDDTSARCRRLALGLYTLADRFESRQEKLATRLRRAARRLECGENGRSPTGSGGGATPTAASKASADGAALSSAPPLPPRHARVLEHLLAGEPEKAIARRLGLSRHTVHEYVKKIYKRLGVGSRAQLVAVWLREIARRDDAPPPPLALRYAKPAPSCRRGRRAGDAKHVPN